jgi:NAD(P)-dependent dehydrogenase (short-subunit alcohol dehydrogenase family)
VRSASIGRPQSSPAAGGIGKAIARELALRGACILVNDLYADGGQHVAGPVLSPGRFR